MSARLTHQLDQFLAFNLDVQVRLRAHRDSLVLAGWSGAEAWALCQRVEERIVGPALDLTATLAKIDKLIEEEANGRDRQTRG